jgi:hypothetical protein
MIWKIRLLVAVALTIGISAPVGAEENFKLLKAKQIRATIVGKDISDDVHWSEYYRKDGAFISTDMGTKQIGTWKIQGDKLCKSKEKTKPLICYEVWMSGDNISLRLHEGDDHFIGVVEKHSTD